MTILDRLLDSRILSSRVGARVEAGVSARLEALRESAGREKQMEGFRRLTDHERDLPALTIDRQREIAVFLWTYNPFARRLINAIVEWIVGEGVQILAPNKQTKEYLDRFWNDPVNRWPLRLEEKVRELFLFGEQAWPVFETPFNGLLRLGVLDPARIKEVITDPENAQTQIGVITKARLGGDERRLRTVLRGEDEGILSVAAERERAAFTDGELFLFQVNKMSTATRGVSELLTLADWIDGYEQMMFQSLTRDRVMNSVIWDVQLVGATEEEIQKRIKDLTPPKPLTVKVHNEKEIWEAKGPPPGAASHTAEHARLFRNHVLGGAAMPEHWFGGGGDVNRATAAEMSGPTEKSFTSKQKTLTYILEDVCAIQIERGIAARALRESDDVREVEVVMPDLSPKDISRVGQSLMQVASGLQQAADGGWVDETTASRVMASIIAHLGVQADAEEMLSRARSERADRVVDELDRRRLSVVNGDAEE